jgi:hypothetical protein
LQIVPQTRATTQKSSALYMAARHDSHQFTLPIRKTRCNLRHADEASFKSSQ